MRLSQPLNSDEQPCAQEEQYDCVRCVGRLFAMSVPAETEVLDELGVRYFLTFVVLILFFKRSLLMGAYKNPRHISTSR